MHHPPFPTGMKYFDEQAFEGRVELAAIVRANPQIRRIVCGHVHQVICRPWSGTVGISAPSTAPTIVLHPHRIGFSLESSGFLLHRYDWNGAVTSELVRLPAEPVAIGA
jgi:3',5'-cyclic AMP phosphodiesterase CpdA